MLYRRDGPLDLGDPGENFRPLAPPLTNRPHGGAESIEEQIGQTWGNATMLRGWWRWTGHVEVTSGAGRSKFASTPKSCKITPLGQRRPSRCQERRDDTVDAGSLLIFWVIFAVIVAIAANSRGRSAIGWFLLAILISPLLALIAVLVIGPGSSKDVEPAQVAYAPPLPAADPRKPCPDCGELVPTIARICRFCRYEFRDSSARKSSPQAQSENPPRWAATATIQSSLSADPPVERPVVTQEAPSRTREAFDRYGPVLLVASGIGLAFAILGRAGLEPFKDNVLLLVLPLLVLGSLSWVWYRARRSSDGHQPIVETAAEATVPTPRSEG